MTNSSDERLQRETLSVARPARENDNREVVENRTVTEDERLEMFRQQLFNDALPDLPKLPGYHLCWLTTTNPRDPIHRRMQLGYEPLKAADIPGMEYASIKTGEWSGMIGVNEMVAFKLPESLYQAFMREAHHDAPMREEHKLAEVTDLIRQQAEQAGAGLHADEGMEDLRDERTARDFI